MSERPRAALRCARTHRLFVLAAMGQSSGERTVPALILQRRVTVCGPSFSAGTRTVSRSARNGRNAEKSLWQRSFVATEAIARLASLLVQRDMFVSRPHGALTFGAAPTLAAGRVLACWPPADKGVAIEDLHQDYGDVLRGLGEGGVPVKRTIILPATDRIVGYSQQLVEGVASGAVRVSALDMLAFREVITQRAGSELYVHDAFARSLGSCIVSTASPAAFLHGGSPVAIGTLLLLGAVAVEARGCRYAAKGNPDAFPEVAGATMAVRKSVLCCNSHPPPTNILKLWLMSGWN